MEAARNVVLFGECGVGKSSIINMLRKESVAKTSNDVVGCTDDTTSYPITLDKGAKINLWDTIGLDEGTAGKVPAELAKQRLKSFLKNLADSDGIDLLLYCVRGASGKKTLPVKGIHWENYKFVSEEVCERKIPVAMIVTHLESYDPSGGMETWWDQNEQKILEFGFQICAHACITVLPPAKEDIESDTGRFSMSRDKLQHLLSPNLHLLAPRNVFLIGDPEDRNEFIDIVTSTVSRNKQNSGHKSKATSPSVTRIPIAFDGHTHVNFRNMSGFDETNDDALVTRRNLKLLVRGIKQTTGIDLLLFCFRAGRPKYRHTLSYRLFYAAICRKKVPVAAVILEPKDHEEFGVDSTWWQRNEQDLKRRGFLFDRHLCIPCDPCRLPNSGGLDDATRHELIDLVQEEHTSGRWHIGDNAFWVTVPKVRAVIGELAWPSTTVVCCDATGQDGLSDIVPGVQTSLRRTDRPQHQYLFRPVDPQSLLPVATSPSGDIPLRTADQGIKGFSLIMIFIRADELGDETWRTLERLYSTYKGGITPFIVVVYAATERKCGGDFWRDAPRRIRKRIGASLTYHPGPSAGSEAQAAAQEILADMIQHRCLVDLGDKVGILQDILSVWKKFRSQRNGAAERAAR